MSRLSYRTPVHSWRMKYKPSLSQGLHTLQSLWSSLVVDFSVDLRLDVRKSAQGLELLPSLE